MPSPECPGCHKRTERGGGLCAWCRPAVIALRPLRGGWQSNARLEEIRQLQGQWVINGLSPGDVDRLVMLSTELDKQLSGDGYLPDDWDPEVGWEETPVPAPRGIEDIHSERL